VISPTLRGSCDDPRRPQSAMAGRPQRDAVGSDAGRIMDPRDRCRRQPGRAGRPKRGAGTCQQVQLTLRLPRPARSQGCVHGRELQKAHGRARRGRGALKGAVRKGRMTAACSYHSIGLLTAPEQTEDPMIRDREPFDGRSAGGNNAVATRNPPQLNYKAMKELAVHDSTNAN
jgi:hypothetical protein